MLQYPTNVYPADATFDANVNDDTNRIGFTFNGDIFTGALYRVYNYDTGSFVKEGVIEMLQSHSPRGYNGDQIWSDPGVFGYENHSPLDNGTNYVFQLQLVQFTADGSAPLYDMFVLRGEVQEDYDPTAQRQGGYGEWLGYVNIKPNIPNIYEWDTNFDNIRYPSTGWNAVAGCMQIVINGERREIKAYQNVDGLIMIDVNQPFTTAITKGTKYQIYSNYIVTQPYYFQCRAVPTVELNIGMIDKGVGTDAAFGFHVTGNYSQVNGSLINYYKLKLQWNWTTDGSTPWRTIDESEKIYSQNINYEFSDDFVLRYKKIENNIVVDVPAETMGDTYYRAVIEIVTVDGTVITDNSSYITDMKSEQAVPTTVIQELRVSNDETPDTYYPKSIDGDIQHKVNYPKHIIRIVGSIDPYSQIRVFPENTKFTYYRENLDTGELRLLESVFDVTVPTKGRFRYYEIPRKLGDTSTTYRYAKGISHKDIELDESLMNGTTITELILEDKSAQWGTRPRYEIGDQWKFVGEIENTTITQNTDRYTHVGYGTYPQVTSTKTNYLSGSVSAMNGYVDCTTKKYTDNIDLVRAWRQFITRQSLFMLKTQKGDVLVVGITGNPTTTYEEMSRGLPTTFAFDWVELCDIDDIKVDYHVQTNPNDVY